MRFKRASQQIVFRISDSYAYAKWWDTFLMKFCVRQDNVKRLEQEIKKEWNMSCTAHDKCEDYVSEPILSHEIPNFKSFFM